VRLVREMTLSAMRCDAIDLVPRRRVAVLIFDFMS